MNKLPKGILLDVDHTMVKADKIVTPRLAQIIERLITETDIVVGLCTGRSYAMLRSYLLSFFPDETYHVVAGGGQVINKKGIKLWENKLPHQLVRDIGTWATNQGGAFSFGKDATYYASTVIARKHFAEQHWKYEVNDPETLSDWSVPLITMYQVPLNPTDILPQRGQVSIKYMESRHGYFADITARNVSKATAATEWAAHYGFKLADILAVGDSPNDMELLQVVGQPIAMGNSIPELKAIAQQTIGSVDEDGLAIFLETLLQN